jgi:hypothetical protein
LVAADTGGTGSFLDKDNFGESRTLPPVPEMEANPDEGRMSASISSMASATLAIIKSL